MTTVGQVHARGRLCGSCHHLRPARTFTWMVDTTAYCSQLCAKRMSVPKPRSGS